ncbi:alpha/beta hydrolase [Cupriavidus malaysiensis]|uniref:alpha/beta hydrolase n=1 Tax=Cupriavidus malaysiensis TaxID=367825 RepID=UPI0009FCB799|nr:alpha/beta hydrolase family protein [Cupriavidus malaysiensis]
MRLTRFPLLHPLLRPSSALPALRSLCTRLGRTATALALALAAGSACAAGQVFSDAAPSPTLGRELKFTVYVPDGYQAGAAAYPVIYLLHGADEDENSWRVKGGAIETMDGLIARGQLRPSIVVMPSEGPSSWWTDGAVAKADTALVKDLLPYVELHYRTQKERRARSVAGLSMGGYGAVSLSLRHPDLFCGAAAISPAAYDPLPPETSAARRAPQFMRNGKFDPDAWKALNYAGQLDAYQAGKLRVPMWIASGDHDRLGIAVVSAIMFWRLYQIQPKQVELRIMDGDHEWMLFRDALPDALRYVDQQCVRS